MVAFKFIVLLLSAALVTSKQPDWFEGLYQVCRNRLDELKVKGLLNSSEVFLLATQIKIGIKTNSTNFSISFKFIKLKMELPKVVQQIIWNEKVFLISSEYLQCSVNDNDEYRREVFTRVAQDPYNELQTQWSFSSFDEGNSFVVKNSFKNEFLYPEVDELAFDDERRSIYLWRQQSILPESYWIVEIVSDNEIKLKSKTYHEYLYAESHDFINDEGRSVFTARIKNNCGTKCFWRVE